MGIWNHRFKRLFSFVTPIFATSSGRPAYAPGEARPGMVDEETGGIITHSANASESAGVGSFSFDLYKDGEDWKVALHAPNESSLGSQVVGTIGGVEVAAGGVVTLPLDLEAMGGAPANELRVHGSGTIVVRHESPLSADFPLAPIKVVNNEVMRQRVSQLFAITGDVTRVRVEWGAS